MPLLSRRVRSSTTLPCLTLETRPVSHQRLKGTKERADCVSLAEIGEKGISLSGGQKARVALARAVYSRAKVRRGDEAPRAAVADLLGPYRPCSWTILCRPSTHIRMLHSQKPFSSALTSRVAVHSAKHLFRKCLKGPLLENRTIILVTHHISLCLPGADYLVRLSAGRIEVQGLVSELDASEIALELQVEAEEEEAEQTEVEEVIEQKKDGAEDAAKKALSPPTDSAGESINPTRAPSPSGEALVAPKGSGKLVDEELRAEGRVKGKVYGLYLRAAGIETWVAIVLLIFAGRFFRLGDRWWFKIWGESYHSSHSTGFGALFLPARQQMTLSGFEDGTVDLLSLPSLPSASDNVNPYLAIYGLICESGAEALIARLLTASPTHVGLGNLFITVLGILAGYHGSFKAARILFIRTLTRVAHAPFRYFDTTPTGRILNRFSADFQVRRARTLSSACSVAYARCNATQIIDASLTDQVRICLTHAFSFIVNVGVIFFVSPKFIPPAVLIM